MLPKTNKRDRKWFYDALDSIRFDISNHQNCGHIGIDYGSNAIDKVIFNESKGLTILKTRSGRVIKSKVHKEKFDKEKGLLMCLCKLNGTSHSELKRLLINAIEQE